MRKAERIFQLLNILRSRRTVVTGQELAETLRVSPRTIYRDMQALSLSNIPIESEAGVGYRLKPGFNLPPIMFEQDELEALLLGVKMVQSWSDQEFGDAATRAFDKIKAILPDNVHSQHDQDADWIQVPKFSPPNHSDISQTLKSAIKKHQQLSMQYMSLGGEQTQREIWPVGLLYWGKVWTLVAWCLLRNDYRVFRLDKIMALTRQEVIFQPSSTLCLKHYIALQEAKHCEK